jgi:hypothetical protein
VKRLFDGQASAHYQAVIELTQQPIVEKGVLQSEQVLPPKEEKPPSAKSIIFEQIIELKVNGYSGRAISQMLFLSRKTVIRFLEYK